MQLNARPEDSRPPRRSDQESEPAEAEGDAGALDAPDESDDGFEAEVSGLEPASARESVR